MKYLSRVGVFVAGMPPTCRRSLFSMGSILLSAYLFLLLPSLLLAQTPTALQIATEGHGEGFLARQKAVSGLARNLDNDSVQVLYVFMESKSDAGLHRDELLALKDAVCTKLDHQSRYPADLPEKLMAMYADTGHDVAWRDYCIQHLNTGFSKATAKQREAIAKVFWSAADEVDSTIAGTALIALNDNSADINIERNAVAAKALAIILSEASGNAARTTALQICAQLGEKKCLPVARKLAATTKDRTLRLSSIAAIGSLGEVEDKALLEKYAMSSDRSTQISAKSALKKMAGVSKESQQL